MTAYPVWFDTDFAGDVDDLADLACLLALHKMGNIRLIGVSISTPGADFAGAASAVCEYFGVKIPIGVIRNSGQPFDTSSWTPVVYTYPRYLSQYSTVPSANPIMVDLFNREEDNSIYILATGTCDYLSQIVDQNLALVTAKVKELILVAGIYPSGSESNFIVSPAAGANAVSKWPTPVTYMGIELGETLRSGSTLNTMPSTDIVRAGFVAYVNNAYPRGRFAWGQFAMLQLMLKESGFSYVKGTNVVNSTTGANTFTAGASGKDRYAIKLTNDFYYRNLIDSWLTSSRSGVMNAWNSSASVAQL
jgi:hypothetical protein